MKMMLGRSLIPLLLSIVGASASSHGWAYQVYIGDPVTLHCNDSHAQVEETDTVSWTVPSGMQLNPGQSDAMYQLLAYNNVADMTLIVKKVETGNTGVYQCVISRNGQLHSELIRGVNLSGPKYHNSIDKYEHNIIVAFVALAVFFVPLVGSCLVYRFRYMSDDEFAKRQERKAKVKQMHAYDNTAMVEIPDKPNDAHGAHDNGDPKFSTQL